VKSKLKAFGAAVTVVGAGVLVVESFSTGVPLALGYMVTGAGLLLVIVGALLPATAGTPVSGAVADARPSRAADRAPAADGGWAAARTAPARAPAPATSLPPVLQRIVTDEGAGASVAPEVQPAAAQFPSSPRVGIDSGASEPPVPAALEMPEVDDGFVWIESDELYADAEDAADEQVGGPPPASVKHEPLPVVVPAWARRVQSERTGDAGPPAPAGEPGAAGAEAPANEPAVPVPPEEGAFDGRLRLLGPLPMPPRPDWARRIQEASRPVRAIPPDTGAPPVAHPVSAPPPDIHPPPLAPPAGAAEPDAGSPPLIQPANATAPEVAEPAVDDPIVGDDAEPVIDAFVDTMVSPVAEAPKRARHAGRAGAAPRTPLSRRTRPRPGARRAAAAEQQPPAVGEPPVAAVEEQPPAAEEQLVTAAEEQPAAVEEQTVAAAEQQSPAVEEPSVAPPEEQPPKSASGRAPGSARPRTKQPAGRRATSEEAPAIPGSHPPVQVPDVFRKKREQRESGDRRRGQAGDRRRGPIEYHPVLPAGSRGSDAPPGSSKDEIPTERWAAVPAPGPDPPVED
jgi:hypothetical protein